MRQTHWHAITDLFKSRPVGCLSIRFQPDLVATPGGYGANVADLAGAEFVFELFDGNSNDFHIGLFIVALVRARSEFFRDENVLALASEAVGDPHPGEFGHSAGDKPSFFAQFAACQFFRIIDLGFPATLRQLKRAFANCVAVLFDQPYVIAIDGQDRRAIVFVDNAIDAASAVRAFNIVFADT